MCILTDWIMVIVTTIYAGITLWILFSNRKSAKAAEEQTVILKQQLVYYQEKENDELIKRKILIGSIVLHCEKENRTAEDFQKYLEKCGVEITLEKTLELCIELRMEEKLLLLGTTDEPDMYKWRFGKRALTNRN